MTRSNRLLSSNTTTSSSLDQTVAQPPEPVTMESDFVVILAALLCALICVLGLFSVARCAWLRRGSINNSRQSQRATAAANKGIKKRIIETLPKHIYKKKDKGQSAENNSNINISINISFADCAICLAEYIEGDEIRVLPQCGHGFHVGCIDKWLASHSSCPSCRQILAVSRCRKCGEFPSFVGESSMSVGRNCKEEQRQQRQQRLESNSCASDYLP